MLREMSTASHLTPAIAEAHWQVSKDGAPVAAVALRHDGEDVVVETGVNGSASMAPRFATRKAAYEFVVDLIASFTYLGCDVSAA